MSDELRLFYGYWWREANSRSPLAIIREEGLCLNLIGWGKREGIPVSRRLELGNEIRRQFASEGLNRLRPFRNDYDYLHQRHLNPLRRDWVQRHMQ